MNLYACSHTQHTYVYSPTYLPHRSKCSHIHSHTYAPFTHVSTPVHTLTCLPHATRPHACEHTHVLGVVETEARLVPTESAWRQRHPLAERGKDQPELEPDQLWGYEDFRVPCSTQSVLWDLSHGSLLVPPSCLVWTWAPEGQSSGTALPVPTFGNSENSGLGVQ